MADAEIIPIGTRGRPGRGTGKDKPSSAARSLAAPKAAPKPAARPQAGRRRAVGGAGAAGGREARAAGPRGAGHQGHGAAQGTAARKAAPPKKDTSLQAQEPARPAATTRERSPLGGIPAGRLAGRVPARRQGGLRRPVGAAARPLPRLPPPPGDRRLRRRRVRLRPRGHRALLHGRAPADRREVVPGRGPRRGQHPGRGRCPRGVQPLRHGPGRRPDDDGVDPRRHRPLPAPARRRPGLPDARRQHPRPQGRRHPGLQRGRRADARQRRAGRRLARGLQGHRQAVRRAVQAPAVRPGRLRLGGPAHRRTDHPAVGRRAPRRSTRSSATSRRWRGCSECPTSRSRRSSRCSGRSAWCRCRRSGCSSSASRSAPTSYDAGAADDPMLVFNVTDQVRETIQQTLYTLLMKRQSVFTRDPPETSRNRADPPETCRRADPPDFRRVVVKAG